MMTWSTQIRIRRGLGILLRRGLHKGCANGQSTGEYLQRELDGKVMTTFIPKMNVEVNTCTYGLPRSMQFVGAIESTMAGAIHLAGQNMIQVYAPHIDPTPARKVFELLLGPHQLAQRSELVLWGQVNDGKNLTPLHVEHQLKHALQALDLTTLDLAVIQIDTSRLIPTTKQTMVELKRLMEYLDQRARDPSPPFRYYAFDVRIPYYQQPKRGDRPASWGASDDDADDDEGGGGRQEMMDPKAMEDIMLPIMLEEAAKIDGNRLALVMYPFHITNKNIVTLPMMSSASKEEEEDGENEEEKEEIEKNLCRMASGPLLGYAANGMAVQLSSQTIPPPMVSKMCQSLNEMCPLLKTSLLLEAKVLRTVLSADMHLVKLDVAVVWGHLQEDQIGLMEVLVKTKGLTASDRLSFDDCQEVFKRFYIPAPR